MMNFKSILIILCCVLNLFVFAKPGPILIKVGLSDESPPTSYMDKDEAKGLLKDLLELVFEQLPEYKLSFYAQPWNRAQYQLQNDELDLFVTYPSDARKLYANFLSEVLYTWNYSYLIYNLDNPKRNLIEQAKSFEDLKDMTYLSQIGVDWEKENVPLYIKRLYFHKIEGIIHSLFRRNAGDFVIMSNEQASYYANKFGYQKKLGIKQVSLITNSQIEFHIGIRKTFKDNKKILQAISKVLNDPTFIQKKAKLIQSASYSITE